VVWIKVRRGAYLEWVEEIISKRGGAAEDEFMSAAEMIVGSESGRGRGHRFCFFHHDVNIEWVSC
jgi:hypothetical protein